MPTLDSLAQVVIAHSQVPAGADPSMADVLAQVALVKEGLDRLGLPYRCVTVAGGWAWEVKGAVEPRTAVVNLLEAPAGEPRRHAAATAVLELLQVPFTGCGAEALWLTTDKLATRAVLATAGLPVAAGGRLRVEAPRLPEEVAFPVIVKPAWEDASVGLEGDPICHTREELVKRARWLAHRFEGQPLLVEEFLPGREFNVSLLELQEGPQVLPVAEMAFVDLPPEVPPVVGFEAKWHPGSPADRHTVRCFPTAPEDGELLARVRWLALAAWRECGLSGYGRVDIRLDGRGTPRILEVNANPCLSADGGFMAAAGQAGLDAAAVVAALLQAALRRRNGRNG